MKTTLRHTTSIYRGSNKPAGMQNAIWFVGADSEFKHSLR